MQHQKPPDAEIFQIAAALGELPIPMRVSGEECVDSTVCRWKGLAGVGGATAYNPLC